MVHEVNKDGASRHHYLGLPLTEQAVINGIVAHGDKAVSNGGPGSVDVLCAGLLLQSLIADRRPLKLNGIASGTLDYILVLPTLHEGVCVHRLVALLLDYNLNGREARHV